MLNLHIDLSVSLSSRFEHSVRAFSSSTVSNKPPHFEHLSSGLYSMSMDEEDQADIVCYKQEVDDPARKELLLGGMSIYRNAIFSYFDRFWDYEQSCDRAVREKLPRPVRSRLARRRPETWL